MGVEKKSVQLVFDLPHRIARGRAQFFVSESNRDALTLIERWPNWPHPVISISGPKGSGKTHLVHVWQERSDARIVATENLAKDAEPARDGWALAIDDADAVQDEFRLFHLINRALTGEGSLLLTGSEPPARWPVALHDLRTRLGAVPVASLGQPDDQLLAVVLLKLFTDRQLKFDDKVIRFMVSRLNRSLAAASEAVALLDAASLSRRAPITVQLAARVLGLEPDGKSD